MKEGHWNRCLMVVVGALFGLSHMNADKERGRTLIPSVEILVMANSRFFKQRGVMPMKRGLSAKAE